MLKVDKQEVLAVIADQKIKAAELVENAKSENQYHYSLGYAAATQELFHEISKNL